MVQVVGSSHDRWLRAAPEHTPLAEVAAAVPFLRTLGSLLSRAHLELKVAAVRELGTRGAGPWRFEDIQATLHWVRPELVYDLLKLLRDDNVVVLSARRYRFTPDGRSVAALIDLLSRPQDPRHVIRELDALIAYALARGDEDEMALRHVEMAVRYLRDAAAELEDLLERGGLEDLQAAVDRAETYREDMRALTARHASFLHQHAFDARSGLDSLAVSDAVPEVALLLYRANEEIAARVRELRQSGVRIDRDTVRRWLARADLGMIAGTVGERGHPVPSPPFLDAELVTEQLRERLRQERRTPPVPPPSRPLDRTPPSPHAPSAAEVARERIAALDAPVALEKLVVGETWAEAVSAQVGVLQALGARDARARAQLFSGDVTHPERGEVWRLPAAELRPREDAAP